MKHIGIAAVTAEGAALCYRTICIEAAKKLGANMHPEITLHTFSFERIFSAQVAGNWAEVTNLLVASIEKLAKSGADFAIIPANSTHFVFDDIRARSPIPLLSIVDVSADEALRLGCKKVLTLGIGITMSRGLFLPALKARTIASVVPDDAEQKLINDCIFNEIIPAKINPSTVRLLSDIVGKYRGEGCDAVLLGCTELPLVLTPEISPLPTIDTTRLLAVQAAMEAVC